ncbi:hypothetical protein TD95_002724 [Thielaviopsis punctulata]|uniref:Isopenicillin N synthase-like Fe(2+) 2OG dioxygenase domain-containing protein n=1 Tax=Thielaviopsis punctulata TaxID=72032 RepID=A0A0F4Z6N0_9PEZI|nr:hypothetical protein TD95_002724 [Thielaviopsis punctulata]
MDLPIVDLDLFLALPHDNPRVIAECHKAAEAIIAFGALIVHDSRVSESANESFLDLMEDYFALPASELKRDERPELSYQIGVTLENTEKPKCAAHAPCLDVIARLAPDQRPLDISAHQPDPKCRFFWRMGTPPPADTAFAQLNLANVRPAHAAVNTRWDPAMHTWGSAMKAAVSQVARMLAVGLDLPEDAFVARGEYGPHLLAPTASDLVKYGVKDTILAGFHTDLNFLTIHGRSRFPGLNIWARNTGRRIAVKIPPGNHLLVQAGKQIEHLTGGLVKAGFHEVVVNDATLAAMQRRRETAPERPLIRISSTFFYHLGSDVDLTPLPQCAAKAVELRKENETKGIDEGQAVEYRPMKVGELVQEELRHIALMA